MSSSNKVQEMAELAKSLPPYIIDAPGPEDGRESASGPAAPLSPEQLVEMAPAPATLREVTPVEPTPLPVAAAPGRVTGRKVPAAQVGVAKFLPEASFVRVHKREDSGGLTYCRQYSAAELASSGSAHVFIQRFCVPAWGAGDYVVEAFGADDAIKPKRVIELSVSDPEGDPRRMARAGSTPDIRRLEDQVAALQQQLAKPPPTIADFARQIEESNAALERIGIKRTDPAAAGLLQQMMAPRADPEIAAALRRMEQEIAEYKRAAQIPPPPLPMMGPPAPNPADQVSLLMSTIGTMIEKLAPKPDDRVRALEERIAALQHDTIKDQLAELKAALNKPARGLGEVMQEMGAVMTFAREHMGAGQEDSLAAAFSKIIESAPDVLDRIDGMQEKKHARQLQLAGKGGTTGPAVAESGAPEPVVLQLPDDIAPLATTVCEAKTDGEIVNAMMKVFQRLASEDDWKPFLIDLAADLRKDQRDKVRAFLVDFCNGMLEKGYFDAAAAERVSGALERNYAAIRDLIAPGAAK